MFDKKAYNSYDEPAKQAVINYLQQNGVEVTYKEEDFSADIETTNGIAHEVEVKAVWDGEWNSRWKDVQIPYRKIKLLEKYDTIYFWVLHKTCKAAWLIDGKDLCEDNTRRINAGRGNNEKFFFVPIEKCKKIKI